MESFLNDEDNPTVTLKGGLDLNDLRASGEPDGTGVCFEVQQEDPLTSEPNDNTCFDAEDLCNNLFIADDDGDSEEDEDDNSTPFEKIAKKMTDICPLKDGGILKQLLKNGSGPVCPIGSLVRIHFNAYQEYADEPFDSSRLQNRVKKFRQGRGEFLEGLDVAVTTMKKGELARFLLKPEYAYLEMGAPPRIGPQATILFEIEMLSFVEQADIDDYFSMNDDEKRDVTWVDVKKLYHSIVKEAKELFTAKQEKFAFPKFKKAANMLENRRLRNEEEEKDTQTLLLRVYLNMAVCCVKTKHSGRAIVYSKKCLDIDKNNAKALYLQGKGLHQLGEFDRARVFLKRAQRQKPSSREINEELEQLERDLKNYKFEEKDMYKKMFSGSGPTSDADTERDNKRLEEAESKSLHCSKEFKKTVHDKLLEFIADPELVEFPMPSYNFTVGEINCVMETAEELGLQANVRGSGQSAQLRVMKANPVTT